MRLKGGNADEIRALILEGLRFAENGDYLVAMDMWEQALDIDPQSEAAVGCAALLQEYLAEVDSGASPPRPDFRKKLREIGLLGGPNTFGQTPSTEWQQEKTPIRHVRFPSHDAAVAGNEPTPRYKAKEPPPPVHRTTRLSPPNRQDQGGTSSRADSGDLQDVWADLRDELDIWDEDKEASSRGKEKWAQVTDTDDDLDFDVVVEVDSEFADTRAAEGPRGDVDPMVDPFEILRHGPIAEASGGGAAVERAATSQSQPGVIALEDSLSLEELDEFPQPINGPVRATPGPGGMLAEFERGPLAGVLGPEATAPGAAEPFEEPFSFMRTVEGVEEQQSEPVQGASQRQTPTSMKRVQSGYSAWPDASDTGDQNVRVPHGTITDHGPPHKVGYTGRRASGNAEAPVDDVLEASILDLSEEDILPLDAEEAWEDRESELLERALLHQSLGDYAASQRAVQDILSQDPTHGEARELYAENQRRLESQYLSRLGSLESRPKLIVSPEQLVWHNLDAHKGFVLSRVDGQTSVEDIIDIVHLPRHDTIRLLAELVTDGIITCR